MYELGRSERQNGECHPVRIVIAIIGDLNFMPLRL